jgi:hypothetical protein
LRLRFAEIVSQIIASDNAIGGLNPSRPILFSVIRKLARSSMLNAALAVLSSSMLDAAWRSEQHCVARVHLNCAQ